MKSVIFSFATHNHQPLGNFDHVFEESYERSYRPFFEVAAKYPIRFATHFTGILLEWMQAHHPEHIVRLRELADNGTLEFISGGYYEPILSVIPPQDQQAQIKLLSDKIRDLFGTEPHGMWLAERVWEQPLASVLHNAGIRYVLLDDTHFLHAGLAGRDLNGYYLTEDQGKTLAIFPISKQLRYMIPFASVDETLRVLGDAASESGTNVVTFADDGEKFGVWPRTFDHVYGDGWLEEFFRKLAENSSWITMLPPGEVLKQVRPIGRIYLPNASYEEMMQWALPTTEAFESYEDLLTAFDKSSPEWQRRRPFIRGGYWRNFLAKYPEANQLHKHMLRTSDRAAKLKKPDAAAYDELLRSQCNDPYWHGVFGGIYLSNLRHANYSALVRADKLLDAAENLKTVRMEERDIDCDGADEVIIESKALSIYCKPSQGGMLTEIDFKPRDFHATNIISRHREAYHSKISQAVHADDDESAASIHERIEAKEAGLEKLLVYDPYQHGCLIEHLLPLDMSLEELRSMTFLDRSTSFVNTGFERSWNSRSRTLELSGATDGIKLAKTLRLSKESKENDQESGIEVTYRLTNESDSGRRFKFASEWAFNLLAGAAPDRYYESNGEKLDEPNLNAVGWHVGLPNLRLVDEYLKVAIDVRPVNAEAIVRLPIESISMSEGGFERIYQGSIVLAMWEVELASGGTWDASLQVAFQEL